MRPALPPRPEGSFVRMACTEFSSGIHDPWRMYGLRVNVSVLRTSQLLYSGPPLITVHRCSSCVFFPMGCLGLAQRPLEFRPAHGPMALRPLLQPIPLRMGGWPVR